MDVNYEPAGLSGREIRVGRTFLSVRSRLPPMAWHRQKCLCHPKAAVGQPTEGHKRPHRWQQRMMGWDDEEGSRSPVGGAIQPHDQGVGGSGGGGVTSRMIKVWVDQVVVVRVGRMMKVWVEQVVVVRRSTRGGGGGGSGGVGRRNGTCTRDMPAFPSESAAGHQAEVHKNRHLHPPERTRYGFHASVQRACYTGA